MNKGGKREGAGGKSSWNNAKTKVIRVPIVLADRILEIARLLDSGLPLESLTLSKDEPVTDSKVIDLSGISVKAFPNGSGVYLVDLVKAGYTLKPDVLARLVEKRINSEPVSSLKKQISHEIERITLNFDKA
jgi:hypothetical protein